MALCVLLSSSSSRTHHQLFAYIVRCAWKELDLIGFARQRCIPFGSRMRSSSTWVKKWKKKKNWKRSRVIMSVGTYLLLLHPSATWHIGQKKRIHIPLNFRVIVINRLALCTAFFWRDFTSFSCVDLFRWKESLWGVAWLLGLCIMYGRRKNSVGFCIDLSQGLPT